MKNEFGESLDRAGYAPSIMQRDADCVCYLCGRRAYQGKMDRHEPFGGIANRKKSQEHGLWVSLCHFGCHEGPGSVHDDPAQNEELRRDAQRAAMLRYGWSREEFILRYGKSHLTEAECSRILTPEKTEKLVRESRKEPDFAAAAAAVKRLFPTHTTSFAVIDGPELPY